MNSSLRLIGIALWFALPLCAQRADVSPRSRQAMDAFFTAQDAYRKGRYVEASQLLEAFWRRHPPGGSEWEESAREADFLARTAGLNFGSPICYSALRMLSECVAWRLESKLARAAPWPVRLTVVLVGRSSGLDPAGQAATHILDSRVAANGGRIMHESLWLFEEYVRAITAGNLIVKTAVQPLPDLEVPVMAREGWAGLAGNALSQVWSAVGPEAQAKTDWWWVVYPSHVPDGNPEFAEREFITGGMSSGPGGSPVFVIDDLWLIRKPAPFLGKRTYSIEERQAYLPGWFQHEFFHRLFASYPEFGLEAKDHQWFDRRTWPGDFEGRFEQDYYSESLHKILQPLADPPLETKLRYSAMKKVAVSGPRVPHDGEQAIRKLLSDFSEARSARDPKRIAGTYAEDAGFVPFGGALIQGREAIEKVWTPVPDGQVIRKIQSIRFLGPEEAAVSVDSHYTGPAGDFRFVDHWIVAKSSGRWQIERHRSFEK